MRVQAFLHAPAEGLGTIADWVRDRGHILQETHVYAGDPFPALEDFDLLVLMGGGMNIYQHRDFPWLPAEKKALAAAIQAGKAVLGVCLGAQLIADVLGAKIYQNAEKEIGWHPIELARRPGPFAAFPATAMVFHWHGDTFEIPPGAELVASSAACAHQAFLYGEKVAGLQFHIEVTPATVADFVADGEAYLTPAPFVQSKEEMLRMPAGFQPGLLPEFLDRLVGAEPAL